jgi:uncharacterized DUF497 family protein
MHFDWDPGNLEHIARHGVTADEVEEVFYGAYLEIGSYLRNSERRNAVAGVTSEGRVIFVVFTLVGACIRVVTAHESRKYRPYFKEARDAQEAAPPLQDR